MSTPFLTPKHQIKPIIQFLLIYLLSYLPTVKLNAQGIKFSDSNSKIDQRTSYNVFGNKILKFEDLLDIEFDFSQYPGVKDGYILRIQDQNDETRNWNIYYDAYSDPVRIRLNEEGHYSLIDAKIPESEIQTMRWIKIKVRLDSKKDSVYMKIGKQSFQAHLPDLPETFKPVIEFGKSNHFIDLPSYAIRNLSVGDQRKTFHFSFKETEGDIISDDSGKIHGVINNPNWLMLESIQWQHKCTLSHKKPAGGVYNPQRKAFYYLDRDSLYIYNVLTMSTERHAYTNECPLDYRSGNCQVSIDGDLLYIYELQAREIYSETTAALLDLNTLCWKSISSSNLGNSLYHHTSFFNPINRELTIFGGSGNGYYSGDFYTLDSLNNWQLIWDIPESHKLLAKRYFTSSGIDGDNIYIFGGMGNDCGDQIVGRNYFYDLFRIDANSGAVEKIWDIDWQYEDMVPVRNMLVTDEKIYTLCYPECLSESMIHLFSFDMADGKCQEYGNDIPILSDKLLTNANLWYDDELKMLFATTIVFDDKDIASEMNIFSLMFPPMPKYEKKEISFIWIIIIGVLAILLVSFLVYLLITNKNKKSEEENQGQKCIYFNEPRPNSIYLFGNFLVMDKENNDVTETFTSQQRQLLCLLMKYTEKNGVGISSKHLSNTLWPDKEEEKVKNSRGVAINKLRMKLSQLDGIHVLYENGYFRLDYDEGFYCDFIEFNRLEKMTENKDTDEMLNILSRGRILEFLNIDIFDSMKGRYDGKAIAVLTQEIESKFNSKQYYETLEIASMIWKVDTVNEMALKYAIRTLRKLKRNDESRIKYADFKAEYYKMYGTDFTTPIEKI